MSSNSHVQHDPPQQLSQHLTNSSCLTSSNANLQQSQAIAGAMKALQQKLSTYEEQYHLLN